MIKSIFSKLKLFSITALILLTLSYVLSSNLQASPPTRFCPAFSAMGFSGTICPESVNGILVDIAVKLNIEGIAGPKLYREKLLSGTVFPEMFQKQFNLQMSEIKNSENYHLKFEQVTPPQKFELFLIKTGNEYVCESKNHKKVTSINLPAALDSNHKPIAPNGLPAFGKPELKYE